MKIASKRSRRFIAEADRYGAHNYHPLPVVLARGKGIYVWDVDGRRYMDFLSAYSALNQGHNHPSIVAAAKDQLGKLALTSRAFHNDRLGGFLNSLCALTGLDRALLMNSGAEGVETAIKAMRLWAYRVKGVPRDRAEIIVCDGNFHGRTTTIVGFSSDALSRDDFGPATPGFKRVPFGDIGAMERAITDNTAGILFEPIQGEAGVVIAPDGYLRDLRALAERRNVLLCADEIQTGLGRTGRMFACDHEGVRPDIFILGKALSGGLYPISAVVGRDDVMSLFSPGSHGSTFGGNPLACAIGAAALDVIIREKLPQKCAENGERMLAGLRAIKNPRVRDIRGRGLLIAIEFDEPARPYAEKLMAEGILAKETHERILRLAPPLIINRRQVDEALKILRSALANPSSETSPKARRSRWKKTSAA